MVWSSPSSEYWQARRSPYFNNTKWVSGVERDANTELAEGETLSSLRKISSRSVKNNFLAYGIIQALVNAIVGGKIVSKIIYPEEEIEKKLNRKLEPVLKAVDINDEVSLEEWSEMVITGTAERGDMLVNLSDYKEKRTGTTIIPELIEASRIMTPNSKRTNKNIINGVETEENGRLSKYYVLKANNDSFYAGYNTGITDDESFIEIPAFKKIRGVENRAAYLFRIPTNQRPNQTRTPPLITPIMGLLRYFEQYLEAVLISARVAACFVGVMKVENPTGTDMNLKNIGSEDPSFSYTDLAPGTLMTTQVGKGDITFASPNRPSDNVDHFLKRLCMFISMAMRDPYISLFLDLSDANYSNYKGGMNEKERMISRWQNRLTWVIEWYIFNVLKKWRTDGLRFSLSKVKIDITFPKFQAGDPEKKARSQKTEIGNKTTTQKYICEEEQTNYEKLIEDLIEQAVNETRIEAERLKTQKEFEEKYNIQFPEVNTPNDRVTEGAEKQPDGKIDIDEEDKKEKRKEGGNW